MESDDLAKRLLELIPSPWKPATSSFAYRNPIYDHFITAYDISILADKAVCPTQDCFIFKLKKKAFMKGGLINSLQLWVYKVQEQITNTGENRLSISVAAVKRQKVLSDDVLEKQNVLISLVHSGSAGWLGELFMILQINHYVFHSLRCSVMTLFSHYFVQFLEGKLRNIYTQCQACRGDGAQGGSGGSAPLLKILDILGGGAQPPFKESIFFPHTA